MWQAIQYVSLGASLAGVALAAAAWLVARTYRSRLGEQLKAVLAVRDSQRVELLAGILNSHLIDAGKLNKEQQFQITMAIVKEKGERWKLFMYIVMAALAFAAVAAIVALMARMMPAS
jgi:Flp pilus assembly protein TadB